MTASHKLAEEMYKQASAAGAGAQAGTAGAGTAGQTAGTSPGGSGKDGAVDADFEVMDEKK
jgi:molecular chaperone DnaK